MPVEVWKLYVIFYLFPSAGSSGRSFICLSALPVCVSSWKACVLSFFRGTVFGMEKFVAGAAQPEQVQRHEQHQQRDFTDRPFERFIHEVVRDAKQSAKSSAASSSLHFAEEAGSTNVTTRAASGMRPSSRTRGGIIHCTSLSQ